MTCKYLTVRQIKLTKYLYCRNPKVKDIIISCANCKKAEYKQVQPLKKSDKPIKAVSKKRKFVSKKTYNEVFDKCHGKCALCPNTDTLAYHHIKYRSEAKNLIDEPTNGIMLCLEHHKLVHSNKKKWQPILLEKRKY